MTTSAYSLYFVFDGILRSGADDKQFLTGVAEVAGLEDSGTHRESVGYILRKFEDIESDIADLPIEEDDKNHLLSFLAPFRHVKSLAHVHMTIGGAKKQFLQDGHIKGFRTIHLALKGHVTEQNVESKQASRLAQNFRDIAQEISHCEFPSDLQRALLRRVLKIASILEHFSIFGSEMLKEELEGLVGAMIVHPQPEGSKTGTAYRKLAGFALAGLGLLASADMGLKHSLSIMGNVAKLEELISGRMANRDGED